MKILLLHINHHQLLEVRCNTDELHCVCLHPNMVHPSPLSPPFFGSAERNWDETEGPPSNNQLSAHICYGPKAMKD